MAYCVCVGLKIEKLPELVQRMMVKLKFCDSWDKDNWNFDSTFCWLGPIPFDFSSCKYHQRWLFLNLLESNLYIYIWHESCNICHINCTRPVWAYLFSERLFGWYFQTVSNMFFHFPSLKSGKSQLTKIRLLWVAISTAGRWLWPGR